MIDYIDDEERDIMNSIEKIDLLKLTKPDSEKQEILKSAARNYKKKETKMNIRIDEDELARIKQFAEEEGLKYQTFVKSVLHKYITGQLVEKRNVV